MDIAMAATEPAAQSPEAECDIDRLAQFRAEFERFKPMSRARRGLAVRWEDTNPCLDDRTDRCGFDRHYVYHTGWAARVIAQTRPAKHVDVSSSLYFASIASAFVPVDYYEYRPVNLSLPGLRAATADLLALPFAAASVESISCMHVIEHVGLGRYGDPLDADGDLKAIAELRRVVARDGSILFVVPVGRPRVVFNAHRIYGFDQVLGYFEGMDLEQFALIPDGRFNRGIVMNPDEDFVAEQNYGCGCFWFRRPRHA